MNTLVSVLSVISTAIGGAFIFSSTINGEGKDLSIYSAIQEAVKGRDRVAKVNKRMDTIEKSVVQELRKGKVLDSKKENQFVFEKREENKAVEALPNLKPIEGEDNSLKKRLKKFDRKGAKLLTVILKDIKNSKSTYEREKKSLELLENRFVFAWNASNLKQGIYEKVIALTGSFSGDPYITVKNVREKSNGAKRYELQVWDARGTRVNRTDKNFTFDEWPFIEGASAEVGRLTDHSSIGTSFVAADSNTAYDIAQDSVLVQEIVSRTVDLDKSQSIDVGRSSVLPISESNIGIVSPNLEHSCIKSGVDGCIINVDKDEKLNPMDPFNELGFENVDFELT